MGYNRQQTIMRKRLFTLTIVLSACIDFVLAVNSTTIKIDDIYYLFTEGSKNVLVTKPDEYKVDYTQKSIVIPSKVYTTGIWVTGSHSIWTIDMGYYNVSGIDNEAFKPIYYSRNNVIESIIIPESVTSIGEKAFYGCTNIFSLTIPNTVTSIGNYAFAGVTNVAYTGVATGSPWGASYINGYVKGNLLFSDEECTTLVACSNNATGDIVIPNSVTSIGDYAFSDCCGLTSITIPNSVTSIGEKTFSGCTSLTSITIPNSVTSIGEKTFSGCSSLTSVTIPNSVTSIGGSAFENCSSLTSVTIPNSVTSIGGSAFENCSSLTSITIPNSVTSIGAEVFYNCSKLTSITIPNSVTSIGDFAFSNCSSLTSITIPNSVTSIGSSVFSSCSSLTSITIPNSVKSIGGFAFYNCSSLTSITIPNSVTSIGGSAFYGCSGLTSVVWNAKKCNDFSEGNTPFYYNGSSYSYNFDLREQITSFTFGDNVESIPAYLCSGMSNLTSITIPNSVTSIGSSAFRGCTSLTSITIPNSVTSIGNNAFWCCWRLTAIDIPNSVTSIGEGAFSYCNSLTSIVVENGNTKYDSRNNCNAIIETATNTLIAGCQTTIIPNSVTSIGEYAFSYCSSLTSIEIPNSVTSIRGYAFYNCSSLTSITIPNSVTSIGAYAFYGCSSLTSVTIPNSVTSIGKFAFENCSSLKSVTMESATPPSIGSSAFDSTTPIYVPLGSWNAYQEDNYWKTYYDLRLFDTTIKTSAVSPTSAAITFSASLNGEDKNKYIVACGMEEGEEFSGNTAEYIGLEPESEYADVPFYIRTTKEDILTIPLTFKTSALTLTTLASKAVSNSTSILLAETNMSESETSCGFEWRRNDQPADMPSNQVLCPVANGLMAGRLKGLKDDVYYKYRAFYKSAAGNMFYGDWQYVFTGDVTVEFDPVLYTYAAQFVSERKATLKGYALAGSDDFTEQGFEYWAESRRTDAPARRAPQYAIGEKHTVTGTGISMRVTLEDLDEGTVYKYRTYAKVGGKTLYGSEMTFITQGTYEDPIETDLDLIPDADADSLTPTPRTPQARKYIRNGILYIELNGITYTAQGHRID